MKRVEAGLEPDQREKLRTYQELLLAMNQRHNLVSAAGAENLWEHHIRHCLALTIHSFPAGSMVVDWGTGGGLPGIPLAIAFPQVQFILIDSTGKKVRAVQTMVRRLALSNVQVWHGRAEAWTGNAHYAVSRATAPLVDLWHWTSPVLVPIAPAPGDWRPGLLALKGGDLGRELEDLREKDRDIEVVTTPLEPLLQDSHFARKVIVHVRSRGELGGA
jgi:16S rRNA (guanine527-N7)-methyltransferase